MEPLDALLANLLPWALTALFILSSIPVEGTESPSFQEGTRGIHPQEDEPSLTKATSNYIDLDDELESLHTGGQLEWSVPLTNATGHPLSTPALADMDGDGTMEIAIASAADKVFLLDNDGRYRWNESYDHCKIEYPGEKTNDWALDYEPPPYFASIISPDINSGVEPDILVFGENCTLCLDRDALQKFYQGHYRHGHHLSTPCISDLEGGWDKEKWENEILFGTYCSDQGYLDAMEVDSGGIFREWLAPKNRTPIMTASVVAADLDGKPDRSPNALPPHPGEELDTEYVCSYPGVPLSIFTRNGTSVYLNPEYDQTLIVEDPETLVFGTPMVGNITGGPECEIIVPYCKGYGNWTNWTGGVKAYCHDGSSLWDHPIPIKGSGVCTSPAVCPIRFSEGQGGKKVLAFGSDDGHLYALDAATGDPLWSFDTGGRVLSSPAFCNLGRDDGPEIVIGSDSGMVFCLDADPSDGIDEGMSYPGDGPLSDVIWAYHAGSPIGISSPVIGDIDLDGQQEVVIGDSEGSVHCISAGSYSIRGQIDWPKFHYDLSNTGFFQTTGSFGVDITTLKVNVIAVDPGMTASYDLRIKNTGWDIGVRKDRYLVTIEDSLPIGWTAWLGPDGLTERSTQLEVQLAPSNSSEIQLNVQTPTDCPLMEMVRVNVSARLLAGLDILDTRTVLTIINAYAGIDIRLRSEDRSEVPASIIDSDWALLDNSKGTEFIIEAVVSNQGNTNDTYLLTLSPPDINNGWNWSFAGTGNLDSSATVPAPAFDGKDGPSEVSLPVKVQVPSGTSQAWNQRLRVTCSSQKRLSSGFGPLVVEDDIMLGLGKEGYRPFYLNDDRPYAMPNGLFKIEAFVWNPLDHQIRFDTELSFGAEGWNAVQPGPIYVPSMEHRSIDITVRAPSFSIGTQTYADLTLEMSMNGTYSVRFTKRAYLTIGAKDDFSISPEGVQHLELNPGRTGWVDMELISLSDTTLMVDPTISFEKKGWEFVIQDSKGSVASQLFLPGLSRCPFRLGMTPPVDSRIGDHDIELELRAGDRVHHINVAVSVRFLSDLAMLSEMGEPALSLRMGPEEERTISINYSNGWNTGGRIRLVLDSSDDPSDVQLFDARIEGFWFGNDLLAGSIEHDLTGEVDLSNLYPGRIYAHAADVKGNEGPPLKDLDLLLSPDYPVHILVHFRVRGREHLTSEDPIDFHLTARNINGTALGSFSMTLMVDYPDLTFMGLKGTEVFNGQGYHGLNDVTFGITNNGSTSSSEFLVRLTLDNGEVYEMMAVHHLSKGAHQFVTFDLRGVKGYHKATLEIDPDNDVLESRDQFMDYGINDNNLYTNCTIIGENVNDIDPQTSLLIYIVTFDIVLVMIIIIGTIIISRSRKKPSNIGNDSHQEE
ncbi:MAG: PQQ-binding-like beta-propeller repeat protein [Candidatus Thermoplasmatota archaeon]|nr:PQQ-binding-like beta-propeller repeat protein [Candidatus Thermoplasmatota archaeon]